jgi:DNA-binding MarR family transcriptional regulator
MVTKPRSSSAGTTASRSRQASDPAVEALQHFRLIFKSVKKHFHWVEQQTGVNGAQLWALAAVVERPTLTVNELAKALAVHQSTASNLVDKLVRQGLLRRERSSEDQRIVHLHAEPKGIRLIKNAPKPLQGVLPDALSRLPVSDLKVLNGLLSSLIKQMKVRDSRGKATPLADI